MSERNLLASFHLFFAFILLRRQFHSQLHLQSHVGLLELRKGGREGHSRRRGSQRRRANRRRIGQWKVPLGKDFSSHRSSSLTESFGYYDPATGRTIMPSDGSKMSFEDVIVFIVGGGNYSEYQHLQVYAKSQNPARVILYGSTDICPANQVELGIDESWGSSFQNCRCVSRNKEWRKAEWGCG